jgi:hypothetical protein
MIVTIFVLEPRTPRGACFDEPSGAVGLAVVVHLFHCGGGALEYGFSVTPAVFLLASSGPEKQNSL